MNDGLKQRIVGAVVLIALAVIFLPMVFEFEDPRVVNTRTLIPPQPEISPVEIPQPVRPRDLQPPKSFDTAFVPPEQELPPEQQSPPDELSSSSEFSETGNEVADTPATPVPPRLTDKGIPEAWVVQVGSFRDRIKAESLVENLIADGHKAYLRAGKSGGKPIYRVFIGPDVLKRNSLADKKAVDLKYGVNSLVRRFEP